MTAAPITHAEFLRAAERKVTAADAVIAARWGEDAGDTAQSSLLAFQADAQAEADRQLAVLRLPRARDVVVLEGVWFDLEGQTVTIPYGRRFGMPATADLLVLRARPDLASGTTEIEGEVRLVDIAVGVELAGLALSASMVGAAAPAGTVVGALQGLTAGSTLTLVADGGGRFVLQGTNIAVGTLLAVLGLTNASLSRAAAPAGTVVGTLTNRRAGSTLALVADAGGRFGLAGGDVVVGATPL